MRGKFAFVNPDELEATLTVTMPIGRWREIRDGLMSRAIPYSHHGNELAGLISQMINDAERKFYATAPPPADDAG